ncbi:non-ribosomal peptide synthase [Photorhabdus laumondii subsp. laumondii]|uniref:Photorhabdus luminescens subsp. laumondii TTO1 complete genome segment 12/17 n=2 Tax=Photorhabdus laumondii subsp. laumondii TaxID=141679 RepID=Q7N1E1_PHOLL|nr:MULTISPECIES: non-ribosomal peptide synthetase [Photorhabdus]AXG48486.1 non-ribosomal peptide synthase [Photorhabdus laumondii subsp. laumondii]MCC8382951.1 non-ribosomal peptide synthase [Photorhabdus laumondii]MCC8411699.1 non-ribosomal peptide synthase [Photorhabdus laumondii]NDK93883.1 non-ribosomal peptide synthase [Photorhabdus laumondii subsp. laumondii]NDL20310.1 non-ribosomal peptide synthase [Photorhabdus laumondii subsp. laumondii]
MLLDKVEPLVIPLNQQQKEIYLDHINREDTAAFNIGGYVEIKQSINIKNLECAIKHTIQEHAVLRCSIVDKYSMPHHIDSDALKDTVEFAHIVQDHHFELSHLDLSGEEEAESKALAIVQRIFSEPFRLAQDVLYRVGLIQLATNRFWLYFISHHIIIDGVGYANWFRRIFDAYQQLSLGNAPKENTGVRFLDLAAQPLPENYSQQFAKAAKYWKELLHHLPDVPFQCRKEGPGTADSRKNSRLVHFIKPDRYKSFLTKASQCNLPISPLFITAIASLVNRINQSDGVLIGTPLHNRTTSAQRNMVGSFISMLPVMCVQNEQMSVAESVAMTARTIKSGYRYRSYPSSALYKDLSLRAQGRERLFDIVFNYQQIDFDFSASGLDTETHYLSHGREDIPLTVILCDYGDKQSTQLQLDYRHDYFSSHQAEHLLQSIMTLVEQMVAQPEALLTSLDLVGKDVEQALWNLSQSVVTGEKPVCPTITLVHEQIEQYAKRHPDAIAIVDGERHMSYATLSNKANQLANYLIEQGVRPDSRVAICLPRSSEMIVAMLATLKAGAAYVPMDPDYPDGRLQFMLTDAKPVVCITVSSIAHRFAACEITTLLLDDAQLNEHLALRSVANISASNIGLQLEHLAYVIYTSGTTGQPKGVMVEHKQLSHFVAHISKAYRLTEHDKFLQFSSVSFDISVEECFGSLCNGGTLVLRADDIHYDFDAFWAFCRHHEISVTSLPTAFWHQLVNYSRQPIESSLRLVILGGEMVKSVSAREWFERGPAIELINTYGPTETTVTASAYCMTSLADVTTMIPIGKANYGTQLYILDTNLKSVPAGFQGELYIGGTGVTRGYLNREQDSAKYFVANPFGPGRLYRTGDIVRQLSNGNLEFIGRNDNQVKINGFRVEPEEISNQLMDYPGIHEAVVYPRQLGSDDRLQLIAYIVAEGTININAIHLAMKSKLADYMLPVAVVQLEKLPLTQNGKLDFKQLPLPQKQDYSQQEFVAPEGEAERVLAQLWQSLLALNKVSRHDNFFALGGHSLLIMSLRAELAQRGYELPMRAIYRTNTLAELALHLSCVRKDEDTLTYREVAVNKLAEHVEHITPDMLDMVTLSEKEIAVICQQVEGGAGNIQDIYPLSPLQEGIFFHHRMNGEHDPYIIPILIKFSDEQKLTAFLHALDKIVERHDVFRTSIHWQDLTTSVQVVHRTASIPLHWQAVIPGLSALETVQQAAFERHYMKLDRAPMMQAIVAKGTESGECFLLLKQHHLLSDHISVLLQIEEMQALLEDPNVVLPTPVQYREFVAHSLRINQSDKGVDYFKAKLSDVVETTAPFGLLNVYHDGLEVNSAGELVGPHLAQQIIGLATQQRISTANIFHLAWALVVAKCSGKDDVVFGSMMSGRMQAIHGSDRILGMLINLLPIRINLTNLSVSEALTQISDELIELADYEHFPLSEALRYSSLPGGTPLFTSLLNLRHKNKLAIANQSHHFEIIEAREYTNYPLEMGVDQLDNDFMMQVHVEPQVGAANVLTYMRTALVAIINAFNQAPQTPLLTLSITPISEQQRIINEFNSPVAAYDKTVTIHQRFEHQVVKTPAAIAAVCNTNYITYAELNQRANQLAHYLIEQGVARNHIVAIYAERSIEFVVAILGIMKAGAAYVPLDPTNPLERLSYMLADSGVNVVLTQHHLNGLTFNGQKYFLLDTDWSSLGDYPNTNPEVECYPNDLAYMIYTSGSTGKPKGALVHHAGALNHIDAEFDVLGFMDSDNQLLPRNFLQSAASSSDVSVWQFLAPLMSGGKTVILPNAMDLPEYVRVLQNEQIHLIQTAPSVLKILLEHFLNKGGISIPLPDLKWLMIIAEPCPVPLVNRWLQNYPQIPVMNGYGPSEASDDITYFIIDEPLTEQVKNIPVGKPLPNLTMYVLDQRMQILPTNVVGELCVSGIGVGKGYWNNPEKTAESFKDNPFHTMGGHGTRLYRTGDLGYWRADGNLELVGRIDNQVKIRGFRVELGEVESALVKLPQVMEAAVLVHKDRVGENCLVAYLVLAANVVQIQQSINDIKQGLSYHLPDYMIPGYYEILTRMPLNAADKINRHELPKPCFVNHHSKWIGPANALEQSLAEIWQSVLNVDQIDRNDNFFHLGGHSLLVIRVISKIRAELGHDIAVKAIFDHPTLIELAAMLKQQTTKTVVDSIQKQPRTDELLPLSFAQERLWILSQIDQSSAEYNMPIAFAVKGKFDVSAAERALNQIIERHEILRTVYIKKEGNPFQKVLSGRKLTLNYIDLIYMSKEQQDRHVAELMIEDVNRIFDLSSDLMIRATFIQCQVNNGVLLFNAHHIASDGWSEDILIREFVARYEAIRNGNHFEIEELDIQYADFAIWQRNRLQGEYLESQICYWKQQLSELPPVHGVPLDKPRPKVRQYQGAVVTSILPEETTRALVSLARRHQMTPFMLFHAALALVLSRHSSSHDIVIGTPVANRLQAELETLIGFFVNTLILRVDTRHSALSDYLTHVKQVHLDAQDNQDVPFEQLVERLLVTRSTAYTPLFQIMLTMNTDYGLNHDISTTAFNLPEVELSAIAPNHILAQFDLDLELSISDQGLLMHWTYDTSLFSHEHIEQLNDHLSRLLSGLVNVAENVAETDDFTSISLANLPILSDTETEYLLHTLNDTHANYPKNKCIHELFEQQAEENPNNIALEFGDSQLTYQQLNEKANQLAYYLLEHHAIQPDTPVGLCVERSLEMVIGMLAILKAGGAYVPLSPECLEERLVCILEDTQLNVVLLQSCLQQVLPDFSGQRVILDNLSNIDGQTSTVYSHYPIANPNRHSLGLTANHLAYVIYTAGSKGRPKGVMIEHGNTVAMLSWAQSQYTKEDIACVLASTSLNFDLSVFELFLPLVSGTRVCIVENIIALYEGIDHEVTLINTVPSTMSYLVDQNAIPSSTRVINLVGEALSANLVNEIYEKNKDVVVYNLYGLPEDTTYSTWAKLDSSINATPTIGRIINNSQAYILDKEHQLVPYGSIGELYVGGASLARGYFNRIELTKERFVTNPFHDPNTPNSSERLFRTGDLVRYLPDGNLEFIGRIDVQVKIRGFRIELGEIEYQLNRQTGVSSSLVLAEATSTGDKQLVAYVKPVLGKLKLMSEMNDAEKQRAQTQFIQDIKSTLAKSLPDYMMPSVIVMAEEWSLPSNGKIDRKVLSELNIEHGKNDDFVEPIGETETLLAEIWQEVLNISQVSRNDNFFAIGGHSLLAIKLISEINSVFVIELSVMQVFHTPSLCELAELICNQQLQEKIKRELVTAGEEGWL